LQTFPELYKNGVCLERKASGAGTVFRIQKITVWMNAINILKLKERKFRMQFNGMNLAENKMQQIISG